MKKVHNFAMLNLGKVLTTFISFESALFLCTA